MGLNMNRISLLIIILSLTTLSSSQAGNFACTGATTTCNSLVGYTPPNATTLDTLQRLFSIKNLRSILGANNLPPSTPRTFTVPANQTLKIPIPCICSKGAGISNRIPVYTVVKDDGLYHIAADIFQGIVNVSQIQDLNGIINADQIDIGQKITIPLPCSCDEVSGQKVVHYAHMVESGSTVEEIATEFGTDNVTLFKLNGIPDDKSLLAGIALDVPLRACNTSVKSDSSDYPLLLSNGTYRLTANNCVRCMCDSSNNWTLHCEPEKLNSTTCGPMTCDGPDNMMLGNSTSASCSRLSCSYAGFSGKTIHTILVNESTCASPSNYALNTRMSWKLVFVSSILFLLSLL